MKLPVTIIVWADACGGARQGWRPTHEAAHDANIVYCVASGYVIKETRKTLTIAPHCVVGDDGKPSQVDGELAIPKGWIVSRRMIDIPIPD